MRLQAAVQSRAGADMELGGIVIDLKKRQKSGRTGGKEEFLGGVHRT